jgi:hypothetical protein
MPDITDPEAVQFSQDYLRPMAEMMRWLQSSGNEMASQWNAGVNAKFPNDTSAVLDSNGIGHPFTGANANTIITRLNGLLADLNAANAMDGVLPATVRPLKPSCGPQG